LDFAKVFNDMDNLMRERDDLEAGISRAEGAPRDVSGIRLTSYPGGAPQQLEAKAALEVSMEMRERLETVKYGLQYNRGVIKPHIEAMPPSKHKQALAARYIDLLKMADVQKLLHYNRTYLYRVMNEAEKALVHFSKRTDRS